MAEQNSNEIPKLGSSESPETSESSENPPPRNRLRRIMSRLPYTGEFAKRIVEVQDTAFKARQEKYEKMTSVNEDLKQKYSFEFDYAARDLSRTESWIDSALFFTIWVVFAVAIPLFVFAPIGIARLFQATITWPHGIWWSLLEVILVVIGGVVAVIIITLPFFVLGSNVQDFFNLDGIVLSWATVLLIVSSCYLYALKAGRIHWSLLRYELAACFIIQVGFATPLFLLTSLTYRSFDKVIERRRQKLHTRAVIIDEFLNILTEIESPNYESKWTEFSHREWLTHRLDTIASCLENYFSRHFLTAAPELNRWTDRETTEMANGVRELVKWIVTPYERTRENFQARIVKYFTAALASAWGNFDRVPAEKLSRRQGLRDRVASAITALLTAAVPVLLLMLLRRLNVISAEPLTTYLTVGAYVWAALSLLSKLDPQYAAKLGALKDITSTLPFGKKGGEGN
jgi:hypothetical protein